MLGRQIGIQRVVGVIEEGACGHCRVADVQSVSTSLTHMFVVAGLKREARLRVRPGHPRLGRSKDVDARDKPTAVRLSFDGHGAWR
jgi:hypothetical protein